MENATYDITATSTASLKAEDDECQIFGNLIVRKMQKYTTTTQSIVQHEIMNILFNADRGYYDANPYPNPSPSVCTPYSQFSQYQNMYPSTTHSATILHLKSSNSASNPSPSPSNPPSNPSPVTNVSCSEDLNSQDIL